MRTVSLLSVIVALLAIPLAAMAQSISPFHLDLRGTLPLPLGGHPGSQIDRASDVLKLGQIPPHRLDRGFSVATTLDLGKHWAVGVRSGLFRNTKDFPTTIRLRDGSVVPAEVRRKITTIPTHALLQYRIAPGSRLEIKGEAGAGVMSFTGKLRLRAPGVETSILAAYQNSPAYLLGAGISYAGFGDLALTGSLDFYQAVTKDGDVWHKRDNPKFLVGSLGIRYPR